MAHRQKRTTKRRKAFRREPEPGEYGSFSIQKLKRDLDAMDAGSESKSRADGAVDIEHEPDAEQGDEEQ